MTDTEFPRPAGDRSASRTAVQVCQGRAAADGRSAGRFSDPVARELLRDDERAVVDQVRAGDPPQGWAARSEYELVRACADVMVPRTVAVDDAVRAGLAGAAHDAGQLVIVGAGLDARAWRMPELAAVDVIEVDHPASQEDKRARVGERAPTARTLRFAAADLAHEELAPALAAAGHRVDAPTTWVWEGVVPYLTRAEVARTLGAFRALSAPGSTLVVAYQAPSWRATLGRRVAGLVAAVGRVRSPTAGEPWRSLWKPAQLGAVLARHGFTVRSDVDLLGVASALGLDPTATSSLRTGRVAVAVRER